MPSSRICTTFAPFLHHFCTAVVPLLHYFYTDFAPLFAFATYLHRVFTTLYRFFILFAPLVRTTFDRCCSSLAPLFSLLLLPRFCSVFAPTLHNFCTTVGPFLLHHVHSHPEFAPFSLLPRFCIASAPIGLCILNVRR